MSRHIAVIPAAGVGARMGAKRANQPLPKQYLTLQGKTLLWHSVQRFLSEPIIDQVIVVVAPDDELYFEALGDLLSDMAAKMRLTVLKTGGATRQDSVLAAMEWLKPQMQTQDWALVHDAARPGLSAQALSRLMQAAKVKDICGAILALPVVDTLKRQQQGVSVNGIARVHGTQSRDGLWAAQTPQMFFCGDLYRALVDLKERGITVTDEAQAMELLGVSAALVQGERRNLKVTHPEDLEVLRAIWALGT